jgi:hypothetical protein
MEKGKLCKKDMKTWKERKGNHRVSVSVKVVSVEKETKAWVLPFLL